MNILSIIGRDKNFFEADIFIHFARTEGFPYALLESISNKKAILLYSANYNYFINKKFKFCNIDELYKMIKNYHYVKNSFSEINELLIKRFIKVDYSNLWKKSLS